LEDDFGALNLLSELLTPLIRSWWHVLVVLPDSSRVNMAGSATEIDKYASFVRMLVVALIFKNYRCSVARGSYPDSSNVTIFAFIPLTLSHLYCRFNTVEVVFRSI
jgi:hypothetical protein